MATISTLGLTVGNWKLSRSPPSAASTAMTTESTVTTNGLALEALRRRGRGDGQAEDQQRAHDLRRLGHRDGEDEEEHNPQHARGHAAGPGHVGVDRREQEGPPDDGEDDGDDHGDDAEEEDLARTDAEDVAEEDVQRLAGVAVVVAEQEHTKSEARRQDHADGGIALGGALAEEADQPGHDQSAHQRPGEGVVGHEQATDRSGEGELARAVDGEGHGAGDDEGADEPAADGDEEGRLERVLGEAELEVEPDAHQCACPWCAWAPGSVGSSSSALTTR